VSLPPTLPGAPLDDLLLNRHIPEASPRDDSDVNPRREPTLDFRDRDLADMRPADYAAIGFISGLEVHQQLATARKLFCRCPAGHRATRVDAKILRHMRPTLSELGKYDACALMEFKTRKDIVYLLERESVCTYELDDTPPFEIDPEAVDIAIAVSLLFELSLVNELHVMRKQYLDGSIPTGFQRTALTGVAGRFPLRVPELGVDREVRVRQISLEEDSCREVANVGHRITFRTDRLGTPLTETVTEPDLLTPWELQAGARLIARTAQATGRVRRGGGAARQDVNVSVAGGRRVEIKGVSYHRQLPRLVHIEAFRQLNLLRIRAELKHRGVTADMLTMPQREAPWLVSPLAIDATRSLRTLPLPALQSALVRGGLVCAVRLPGFAGLLKAPTQPGLDFAQELSERVRVIACLEGRHLLTHSDADAIAPATMLELRAALKARAEDAVVVLWGPLVDLATAVREVVGRAREALDGVPSETRTPLRNGTTGFERLLPGPERMYPDTDTPPVEIRDERVAAIASHLPETPWARAGRYRALGLASRAADELAAAPWAALYDAVAPDAPRGRLRLAALFAQRLAHLTRRGAVSLPDAHRLRPLVTALECGDIRHEALPALLDRLVLKPAVAPEAILAGYRANGSEKAELDAAVATIRARLGELKTRRFESALRWAMGLAMPGLLGRVDPAELRKRLEPVLRELAS